MFSFKSKKEKFLNALEQDDIKKANKYVFEKDLKKKVDQINVGKYVPHNKRFEEIRIFC